MCIDDNIFIGGMMIKVKEIWLSGNTTRNGVEME